MTNKTILIVDDSEFDRNMLVKALNKKTGFNFIQAESGEECLKIVEEKKIDLILMDIMMPGVYGTQVLLKIREKFNPIELPIIMATVKGDAADVINSLQSGANDYITKPINFEVAFSRIKTHLTLSEFSLSMSKLKEIAALDALITTYNHEINNPLTIALGCLSNLSLKGDKNAENLKSSLWRIADIVKKIQAVSDKKEVEFQDYSSFNKMLKLK